MTMNAFHLSPEGENNSLNLCKSMGFHGISKGFSGCSPNAMSHKKQGTKSFTKTFLLLGETSSQARGLHPHKLGGLCCKWGGDFFLPYKSRVNGVISLLIGLIIPLNLLFGQL